MKQTDLLVIGDAAIDMFMLVDKDFVSTDRADGHLEICFFHGSKVPVEKFQTSVAGNSCHVAAGCSKLGLKTTIYLELGDDQYAERIIKEMQEHKVDTTFCIKNKGIPTHVHAIVVYKNDRTIFSYHEKYDYKIYDWPKPKWIFYSTLAKGFEKFQKNLVDYVENLPEVGVVFNPGSQQLLSGKEGLSNILKVTDVLIQNKEEAQGLLNTTEKDILKLHQKLQRLGPKLTVITEGPKGSSVYDGKALEKMGVHTPQKPIIDKTGAGDAYTSGFLAGLFYNKSLKEAMKWGTINAAGVMTDVGALKGLKTKSYLEAAKLN